MKYWIMAIPVAGLSWLAYRGFLVVADDFRYNRARKKSPDGFTARVKQKGHTKYVSGKEAWEIYQTEMTALEDREGKQV